MKPFMDKEFLLSNETSSLLYHKYAEAMPIVDYHCHISPQEIAEDRKFENITQVWLGGDHYKWRQMRSNGIDEYYITGGASDREKFQKWAETLEKAIGNPLYHWSHLELRRYFGYEGVLNSETAEEVWNLCNEKLHSSDMSVRNLIRRSGVKIDSFAALKEALKVRMDYYESLGCCVSDHALEFVMCRPASDEAVEAIFAKRLKGEAVSREEELIFKTAFMLYVGKEYHRRNWVMQLHYGCKRDNNVLRYKELGPDTGYDCIRNNAPSSEMADFLNALNVTDELPKTILYSLDPADNEAIDTILGCFQDASAVAKIQHGSAWWFNDHKTGMIAQMTSLANLGLLSNFIGMLTDSRSCLSYTRHEYFRRILCDLIGTWVENGEYPFDEKVLGRIVQDISYNNAVRYFGFEI